MNNIRIGKIYVSKYVLFIFVLANLFLFNPELGIAGYDGLLVNYSFPQEIIYIPGRLIDQKITFTVSNTGDQSWTSCKISDFPVPKYIPAYKINITNLSWNANSSAAAAR